MHQGDHWDKYHWLHLHTGMGRGLKIHSIILFSEMNVLTVPFQQVRVREGRRGTRAVGTEYH